MIYYTKPTADTNSRIIYKRKQKETNIQYAQKQTQKQYKTLYKLPIEKWKILLYNIDTTKDKSRKAKKGVLKNDKLHRINCNL